MLVLSMPVTIISLPQRQILQAELTWTLKADHSDRKEPKLNGKGRLRCVCVCVCVAKLSTAFETTHPKPICSSLVQSQQNLFVPFRSFCVEVETSVPN